MKLRVYQFSLGFLPTNCYLLVNEETGHAALVDPAVYDASVTTAMNEHGVTELTYILLTHGHFDHILGVPRFKELHPEAKVVISKIDERALYDPNYSLVGDFGMPEQHPMRADLLVEDGTALDFDEGSIKVIHTPGHTEGSVCYQIQDILLTGDTLFQMSCGRTDFIDGDPAAMRRSLKKLAALPGNYQVLPGHDALSDLDFERQHNPYL
ncbi:MAG: MBL fold metallo-hydrolase [Clostridia bacterium]|nr:MBL fold metallo-hydrolase [Clostridia bacterium]